MVGARALPEFHAEVESAGLRLVPDSVDTLQLNLGLRCNQTCSHCHLSAGPTRRESMPTNVAFGALDLAREADVECVELTGGAPELHPDFRSVVRACRDGGRRVVVRTNLTVLEEPGFEDLPGWLAELGADLVGSLPCYQPTNVDTQRGNGVFDASIRALRRLNDIGYGRAGSGLVLDLVHNPGGAACPEPQDALERDYRRALGEAHGIVFNRLYTLTNVPIGRFRRKLSLAGAYGEYLDLLVRSFNPRTVGGLMCRSLVSVGWDGRLYDCDFNQALGLPIGDDRPLRLPSSDPASLAEALRTRRIRTGPHCFACTAGAGSSCRGTVTTAPLPLTSS